MTRCIISRDITTKYTVIFIYIYIMVPSFNKPIGICLHICINETY